MEGYPAPKELGSRGRVVPQKPGRSGKDPLVTEDGDKRSESFQAALAVGGALGTSQVDVLHIRPVALVRRSLQ